MRRLLNFSINPVFYKTIKLAFYPGVVINKSNHVFLENCHLFCQHKVLIVRGDNPRSRVKLWKTI